MLSSTYQLFINKGSETHGFVLLGEIVTLQLLTLFSGFELFASAGVLGLAASMAFQSAIKDAIAGSILLWRDACAVGDVIAIDAVSGYVEPMGLLLTQLRASGGELITLRNGNIDTVRIRAKTAPMQQWNVSREYRRRLKLRLAEANISIGVPQQAMTVQRNDKELESGPGAGTNRR